MRCKKRCSRTNRHVLACFQPQTMANEVRTMANEVRRPGCRPRGLWVCGPASLNYYRPTHRPGPNPLWTLLTSPERHSTLPKSCTSTAMELIVWRLWKKSGIQASRQTKTFPGTPAPTGHRDPPAQTGVAQKPGTGQVPGGCRFSKAMLRPKTPWNVCPGHRGTGADV